LGEFIAHRRFPGEYVAKRYPGLKLTEQVRKAEKVAARTLAAQALMPISVSIPESE
jgi:hypothetical protein